jgi:hypothetical protein
LKVAEQYKVKGDFLKAMGYTIADDDLRADFWFRREWDANAETWFQPIKVKDAKDGWQPKADDKRTIQHNLGFPSPGCVTCLAATTLTARQPSCRSNRYPNRG